MCNEYAFWIISHQCRVITGPVTCFQVWIQISIWNEFSIWIRRHQITLLSLAIIFKFQSKL